MLLIGIRKLCEFVRLFVLEVVGRTRVLGV